MKALNIEVNSNNSSSYTSFEVEIDHSDMFQFLHENLPVDQITVEGSRLFVDLTKEIHPDDIQAVLDTFVPSDKDYFEALEDVLNELKSKDMDEESQIKFERVYKAYWDL